MLENFQKVTDRMLCMNFRFWCCGHCALGNCGFTTKVFIFPSYFLFPVDLLWSSGALWKWIRTHVLDIPLINFLKNCWVHFESLSFSSYELGKLFTYWFPKFFFSILVHESCVGAFQDRGWICYWCFDALPKFMYG